jgi:putative transposase
MLWKRIAGLARRLRLVKLALRGQQGMSQLCRLFGVSRRTGYKWRGRFEREGMRGLRDRSHRPHRSPQQLGVRWLKRVRRLRRRHRSWGSRKLAAALGWEYGRGQVPSARTIDYWLRQLPLRGRRPRRSRLGPPLRRGALTLSRRSNQVWTVDFKGWFRTRDGQRVEPLTVRDLFSRYLLAVRVLRDQSWQPVRRVFMRLFGRYGYPSIIRVDNGSPFGSSGPAGLSRLSAWWTALGIGVEFIAPGHPEQNGGHEQMHRVLKAETTRPASKNLPAQQRRTDRWVRLYNEVRPHQGLGQRSPAAVYGPQPGPVREVVLSYPKSWATRQVRSNGQIKWRGRRRFIGQAFVGHPVGLKQRRGAKWRVYFAGRLIGELWQSDGGGMRPANYRRRS